MLLRLVLTIRFTVYGLFYIPVALVKDMLVFFFNLYTEASKDSLNSSKKHFSRDGFQLFDQTLDEILLDLEQKKSKMMKSKEDLGLVTSTNGGLLMDMTAVNIILQEKFDVIGEVHKLIFDNRVEGKFLFNPYTKKS